MRLSKSRFVAGTQCHKLLWWRVHDPGAVELQPDKVLQDRFDQGRQVEGIARGRFQGGVLIDLPHDAVQRRLDETRSALQAGASVIFEAGFIADDTFVAADVLERDAEGCRLIEVKSSSSLKDDHIADAAVQVHVLRRSGIDVRHAEVMHLNKEFHFPDKGDLFVRADVTAPVEALLPGIPGEIAAQIEMLGGPLPDVPVGLHCFEPRDCPFLKRCWPDRPVVRDLREIVSQELCRVVLEPVGSGSVDGH